MRDCNIWYIFSGRFSLFLMSSSRKSFDDELILQRCRLENERGFRPDEKRSIILTYSTTNVWRLTSRFVCHQAAIRKRWSHIERDSRRSDSDPTKCSSFILPYFFSATVGSINMKWRNLFFLDFSGVKKTRLVLSLSSIVCLNGKIVLDRKREDEKEEE